MEGAAAWPYACRYRRPRSIYRMPLGLAPSTFKSADDVRLAAARCPIDRLLVETDSPYLAPVPYRGRPNSPSLVPVVGAAVAAVRGVATEVVEAATWTNAAAVFGLPDAAADGG